MIHISGASPFIDAAAVEAWDAWFRWREKGELRDLSVDETWARVAAALVSVEPEGKRAACMQRLLAAFSSWRLLPDERILATAGTPAAAWRTDDLVAVLNIACFVSSPGMTAAALDLAALRDIAALAVHALDNAAMLLATAAPAAERLRIGIIGFGDALVLLGIRYDSASSRALAGKVARALAQGCAKGSVALARQRTPLVHGDAAWKERAHGRGLPRRLINDAERYGLRHHSLTAITSQRRLALFANGVADGLEPAAAGVRTHVIEAAEGQRRVRSPGYAASLTGRAAPGAGMAEAAQASAKQAVCEAMQAWIDEPIAVPA